MIKLICSLFRRPLGRWFNPNLCNLITGIVALTFMYFAYLYLCSKDGVAYMLVSSITYVLICILIDRVAQLAEQVASKQAISSFHLMAIISALLHFRSYIFPAPFSSSYTRCTFFGIRSFSQICSMQP